MRRLVVGRVRVVLVPLGRETEAGCAWHVGGTGVADLETGRAGSLSVWQAWLMFT